MDTHDNDNFDPWTSLGLATAMLLNRLHCQAQLLELTGEQKEEREENPEPSDKDKHRGAEHRSYVEQRLRDWAAFERKAKGIKF